jgi:hypothetical protein
VQRFSGKKHDQLGASGKVRSGFPTRSTFNRVLPEKACPRVGGDAQQFSDKKHDQDRRPARSMSRRPFFVVRRASGSGDVVHAVEDAPVHGI